MVNSVLTMALASLIFVLNVQVSDGERVGRLTSRYGEGRVRLG